MGSRFRQTFQRWMPRAGPTTGAASTTSSSPAGRPKSPDDSTPSGFDTASYWPIESLTNSQMTNLPFVFQACEVVHPDACEASPKSHVQLYGPMPPLGCAIRPAVSPRMAGDGPTSKLAVRAVTTWIVCVAVALCPEESVRVSVTLYAPVAFHAYETEHPVPKLRSPKSHEQRYPPDPPPPVATRKTVSFTPARDRDVAIETESGPPGGPRLLCTSTEPFCQVWFPPESPRERLTTK